TDTSTGNTAAVESGEPLEFAQKRPMNEELLREQFGRTGGTLFALESLELQLNGDVIVPIRELNRMRREALEQLTQERRKPPVYTKREVNVYADARPQFALHDGQSARTAPESAVRSQPRL